MIKACITWIPSWWQALFFAVLCGLSMPVLRVVVGIKLLSYWLFLCWVKFFGLVCCGVACLFLSAMLSQLGYTLALTRFDKGDLLCLLLIPAHVLHPIR